MEVMMKNPMQANRLVGQWIQILCALQDFHHNSHLAHRWRPRREGVK